ncbi:hypothetical protein ACXET9_03190 [Brachybacterium sp. DNPG3]
MSVALPVFVLVVPAAVLLGAVALLLTAGLLGSERTGLRPGALVARWAGLLLGTVGVLVTGAVGARLGAGGGILGYGAAAAFAPAVGAVLLALAVGAGELTLPARLGDGPRTASLVPRTLRAVVPRRARIVVAIGLAHLLATTIVLGTMALDGRAYETYRVDGTGEAHRTVSTPFPGWWYSAPLWAGLLVALAAGLAVIAVIVRRRPSGDVHDLHLRRCSATSVLGGVALAVSAAQIAISALAAQRIGGDDVGLLQGSERAALVYTLLSVAVGLASLLVGLAMVVLPALVLGPSEAGRRERDGRIDDRADGRADDRTGGRGSAGGRSSQVRPQAAR